MAVGAFHFPAAPLKASARLKHQIHGGQRQPRLRFRQPVGKRAGQERHAGADQGELFARGIQRAPAIDRAEHPHGSGGALTGLIPRMNGGGKGRKGRMYGGNSGIAVNALH